MQFAVKIKKKKKEENNSPEKLHSSAYSHV